MAFTIGQRWITGKSRWRCFHPLGRGTEEGPSKSLFGIIGVGVELLMRKQCEGGRVTAGGGSGAEPPVGQGSIFCHNPEPPYSIPGLLMCSPG